MFYFQSCQEGSIILYEVRIYHTSLKDSHPIDSEARDGFKKAQPYQTLPTFLRGTYGMYFFSFKANVETLSRRDLKPLNFELRAECKAI